MKRIFVGGLSSAACSEVAALAGAIVEQFYEWIIRVREFRRGEEAGCTEEDVITMPIEA